MDFIGLTAIVGALILGGALAYALIRNQSRNRRNDAVGDRAAREQYRDPEGYDPAKFRRELEPNSDGTLPTPDGTDAR